MNVTRKIVAGLIAVAPVLAAVAVAAPAQAAPCKACPPLADAPKIAFTAESATSDDVFVMYANNTGTAQLTSTPGFDGEPTWSPNRAKIAFTSTRDTVAGATLLDREIYVMNADGSGQTRITSRATQPGGATALDHEPDWGSNGRIVFTSNRDGNSEIFSMRSDGTDVRRLTNHVAKDFAPHWSPDGQRIVFVSARDGGSNLFYNLYVMNADGSNVQRLTSHAGNDFDPAWSLDGTKIAFSRELAGGNQEIYWVPSTAFLVNPTQVTNRAGFDGRPSWTSAGTIVYASNPGGNTDLRSVKFDGTGDVLVRGTAVDEDYPDWTPKQELVLAP